MSTSFKPTLAVAADFTKISYPVYASPKLDGIRCSVVDGKALTRSLKALPNAYLNRILSNSALEGIDGELIVGSPTAKDVYTKTVSHVMSFDGKDMPVAFYLFDFHDIPAATFRYRLNTLKEHINTLNHSSDLVQLEVLEQVLVNNETELLAYEAKKVEQGYEGIILRGPESPYKYGRSTVGEGYMLKVKRFEDAEAIVVGIEEEMHNTNTAEKNELGRTKRSSAKAGKVGKGTMGALIVEGINGQFKDVTFNIGTGFTAAQRAEDWAVGTIVKYKFFPIGCKDKPRHPVLIGRRAKGDM